MGSRFTLGVWGLRVCSLDVAFTFANVRNRLRSQPSATARNRPQPFATVRVIEGVIFGGFKRRVASFLMAGVGLGDIQTCFVTCRRSFCVAGAIFLRRRWVAVFVAGATLWTCHRHFAWQAQHFRRVVLRVFQNALAGLRQVARVCRFRGRRGILWDVMKIDGSLARNIDFEVVNFQVLKKNRRKTSILKLQSVKIGGCLARNAHFDAPTCLVSSLWFSCGIAVSMGEAARPLLFEGFQAGCHIVLRGTRGALWHSNLFDNVSKVSKLEDVSHEMLVFLRPRVSSRVSGFPVASLCLWGKLENMSFSNVSKQVVMAFCVAGVALCDIPTCLITCGKYQNWRKPRTKCSFFCTHVSRFESLVFLWRRRVYGGSCKTSPFRRFPSRLSYRFAWQAQRFVTFQPVW